MRKRLCFCGIATVFIFVVCVVLIWYRKPKEYCIIENAVKMCDETGEKVILMTCELYLHQYFFKGSEMHGSIYVDGVKYTSIFDLKEYQRWTEGFTNDNDFFAKLAGREFAVPFINVEYWTKLQENDFRTDMFFRQETIDEDMIMFAEEDLFMFTLFGEDREATNYFGPAGNVVEYDAVMKKIVQMIQ